MTGLHNLKLMYQDEKRKWPSGCEISITVTELKNKEFTYCFFSVPSCSVRAIRSKDGYLTTEDLYYLPTEPPLDLSEPGDSNTPSESTQIAKSVEVIISLPFLEYNVVMNMIRISCCFYNFCTYCQLIFLSNIFLSSYHDGECQFCLVSMSWKALRI